MEELALDRGLAALHERLLLAIRSQDHDRPSDLNGIASALSLMLLGHDGILEGVVRDAARYAAGQMTPQSTDADIIALFLSRLPRYSDGGPVRELFFAEYGPESERGERVAKLVAEYTTLTCHGCTADRTRLLGSDRARDLAVEIVETMLRPSRPWAASDPR